MLPQAKDASGHQELEEAGRILPCSLQGEHGPARTLILDSWPPDCERVSFCCFKPPRL